MTLGSAPQRSPPPLRSRSGCTAPDDAAFPVGVPTGKPHSYHLSRQPRPHPYSLTSSIIRNLLWLISALWSISGALAPLIHRQARIHHSNGARGIDRACGTSPAGLVLGCGDDSRTIKQTFAQLLIRRDSRVRCGGHELPSTSAGFDARYSHIDEA